MGTALNNHVAPLWVWIVVIVIGSILIILLCTLLVWCLIRKSRKKHSYQLSQDPESNKSETDARLRELGQESNTGQPTTQQSFAYSKSVPGEHDASGRQSRHGQHSRDIRSNETTPTFVDARSQASPSPFKTRESPAPRLSLESLGEKTNWDFNSALSNYSDAEDVIATPAVVVTTPEPAKKKAINFSRPVAPRRGFASSISKRLSVINESTARNSRSSMLSIASFRDRIVSWIGLPEDESVVNTEHDASQEKEVSENVAREENNSVSQSTSKGKTSGKELPTETELPRPANYPNESQPLMHKPSGSRPQSRSHSRTNSITNFSRRTPSIGGLQSEQTQFPIQSRETSMLSASNVPERDSATPSMSGWTDISASGSMIPAGPGATTAGTMSSNASDVTSSWADAPMTSATLSTPFDAPGPIRISDVSLKYSTPASLSEQYAQAAREVQQGSRNVSGTAPSPVPPSVTSTVQTAPDSSIVSQQPRLQSDAQNLLSLNIPGATEPAMRVQRLSPAAIRAKSHERLPPTALSNLADSQNRARSRSGSMKFGRKPSDASLSTANNADVMTPASDGEFDKLARGRSDARSRSRGPMRTRSKSGHNVLRKRSLQHVDSAGSSQRSPPPWDPAYINPNVRPEDLIAVAPESSETTTSLTK